MLKCYVNTFLDEEEFMELEKMKTVLLNGEDKRFY